MFEKQIAVVLFLGLLTSTGCVDAEMEHAPPSASAGTSDAFQLVSALGLEWSNSHLGAVPASAGVTPNFASPLDIANQFSPARFHFKERRGNGRDVYRDDADNITVKVDAKAAYWKLIRNDPGDMLGRALTKEEVQLHAQSLIEDLGIPSDQVGDVIDSPLEAKSTSGERSILGHTIVIHREVNGLRVLGSFAQVTIDGAGEVMRAEVRWPAFALAEGNPYQSPEEVTRRFADALDVPFSAPEGRPRLEGEVAYRLTSAGTYEPVARLWAFEQGVIRSPTLMEIGLTTGTLESSVFDESAADQ